MSRRNLLSASCDGGGGNNIFPMNLTLNKISNSEYRLDPNPETIALVDYIIENRKFDGIATYGVDFQEGMLTIDGVEVRNISANGTSTFVSIRSWWFPYLQRWGVEDFYIVTDGDDKGMLIHYED